MNAVDGKDVRGFKLLSSDLREQSACIRRLRVPAAAATSRGGSIRRSEGHVHVLTLEVSYAITSYSTLTIETVIFEDCKQIRSADLYNGHI